MVKVGDEVAFEGIFGVGWQILEVTKITSSGRIVCGTGQGESQYTLNPDMTVRGRSYGTPFRGQEVTDAIRDAYFRQCAVSQCGRVAWGKLTTDQLRRVVAILNEKPPETSMPAPATNPQ